MKIRNGFISNSSSTSFCIIGVSDSLSLQSLSEAEKLNFKWDDDYKKTKKARGCEHKIGRRDVFCKRCGKPAYVEEMVETIYDNLDYGFYEGKVVSFFGNWECPEQAGIDAVEVLMKMTLPQAKEYFCKLVKEKLRVDISPNQVNLLYGEASSEG